MRPFYNGLIILIILTLLGCSKEAPQVVPPQAVNALEV